MLVANRRPMGRPPLNVRPTVVRLRSAQRAQIDALLRAGEKRAAFIREAIDRELRRREGIRKARRGHPPN
jgi:hypothetical protein